MTPDNLGDQGCVGESHRFEGLGVLQRKVKSAMYEEGEKTIKAYRSGNVSTGDSLRGSVEEVESGRLADLGKDFGTDTERYTRFKQINR